MATKHIHRYICYVSKCPKCGRNGSLVEWWMKREGRKRFGGPYFYIKHAHQEYSAEKYRILREKGLSSVEARGRHDYISRHAGQCYFGKTNPLGEIVG